jgi:outer membrane protein assembly factor BamB
MINLGPTSDANRVYVTTAERAGGRLHALDIRTGATLWSIDTFDRAAVASAPLLDRDGRIYLADGRAMHAFDPSGHLIWRVPIDGFPLSAQFTRAGHLIFITQIGKIYVLRRSDGSAVVPPLPLIPGASYNPQQGLGATMKGTRESPVSNTPAIDLRTDRFYFTFWTPGRPAAGVRAMQLVEGRSPALEVVWTNDSLAGGSGASPDISADGARIYLTDNSGRLLALDAQTGRQIWSFLLSYEARGSVSTSPTGLIMPAGGRRSPLQAVIDRGNHAELLWRLPEVENRGIPTQIAGGLAYAAVAATSGQHELDLLVIDTSNGHELDREHLTGGRFLTVGTTVAEDGTVFVPTINGHLFAFRRRSAVLANGRVGMPPAFAQP